MGLVALLTLNVNFQGRTADVLPIYLHYLTLLYLIISPNEVFGDIMVYITEQSDIMVLASPPRPPVDPDNVNALTG